MNKLSPCPFCGGGADCNNTGIMDKDGNPLWWVECMNCGVNTAGSDNKAAQIAAWNRRLGTTKRRK